MQFVNTTLIGWLDTFFISNAFFSTQPQCCLTLSWIEFQMLLRCCLIHITIIVLRHFLYLLYLCPCLDLSLFMTNYVIYFLFLSCFSFVLIAWIQTHLFFCSFFSRSVATEGAMHLPLPPSHFSFWTKKVQQFQFQTSGILLFTGVQNLYGLEISRFLACIPQFLDNLQRLFIFSN